MVKFAIIESGGKQYRVQEGQAIRIEKLPEQTGDLVRFDRVLAVGNEGEMRIGAPNLKNARVEATVTGQDRQKKIEIIKLKRRKHHLKRIGHRQSFTQVKINQIIE